jgi:hypothetical protein
MTNIQLGRDNESVELENGYSVDIYNGKLTIFSECCSRNVPVDKAIEIRNLINRWLQVNVPKNTQGTELST